MVLQRFMDTGSWARRSMRPLNVSRCGATVLDGAMLVVMRRLAIRWKRARATRSSVEARTHAARAHRRRTRLSTLLATCICATTLVLGWHEAASAAGARNVKLRFPRFTVPAGAGREFCSFAWVPTEKPLDIEQWGVRMKGLGRGVVASHFLVQHYAGTRLDEFVKLANRVVENRGCLRFGPADGGIRTILFSASTPRARGAMFPGMALRLEPSEGTRRGVGFVFSTAWNNGTDKDRRGSAQVVLRRPRNGAEFGVAQTFATTTAELGLSVSPGTVRSTEESTADLNALQPERPAIEDVWGPGAANGPAGDVCVLRVSGRMHKRGRFLGVDLLRGGELENGDVTVKNPFDETRLHLFGGFDYTDLGSLILTEPVLMRASDRLRYACWTENGANRPGRLGCEEQLDVPPGTPVGATGGGPSKRCSAASDQTVECPATDTAFPGRTFTGRCVLATAVAGSSDEDEACAMTGIYFPAFIGADGESRCVGQ